MAADHQQQHQSDHSTGLGAYDHYLFDERDSQQDPAAATALALQQTPDTLGASASGPGVSRSEEDHYDYSYGYGSSEDELEADEHSSSAPVASHHPQPLKLSSNPDLVKHDREQAHHVAVFPDERDFEREGQVTQQAPVAPSPTPAQENLASPQRLSHFQSQLPPEEADADASLKDHGQGSSPVSPHHTGSRPAQQPLEPDGRQLHDYDPDYDQDHQAQGGLPQPYSSESVPAGAASAFESSPVSRSSHPQQAPSLYSPRSTRSHSLAASLASPGNQSQSPIRRKPLSPTASPLAVRFSSKLSYHMPPHDLPLPQQPDSGFFSLDSPDLYDLSPNKRDHEPSIDPTAAVVSENSLAPSLPPQIVEEQSDDE